MREGVAALSIDKIVKESGTSKGSFLYHFKNKQALFHALVEEYVNHLDERMNFHTSKYKDAAEPLILGYASWYADFDKDDRGFAAFGVAILALQLHDPQALKPFYDWYARLFKKIQESDIATPRFLAAIMAFEGFFFTHKMGFDSMDKETKIATWNYIVSEIAPQPKRRKTRTKASPIPVSEPSAASAEIH